MLAGCLSGVGAGSGDSDGVLIRAARPFKEIPGFATIRTQQLFDGDQPKHEYIFHVTLKDSPPLDTLVLAAKASLEAIQIVGQHAIKNFVFAWNVDTRLNTFTIIPGETDFMPDDTFLVALRKLSDSAKTEASAQTSNATLAVITDDESIDAGVRLILDSNIAITDASVSSKRFSLGWNNTAEPPLALLRQVVRAAPSSVNVHVTHRTTGGSPHSSVSVTWPEFTGDQYLGEMRKVTDLWAAADHVMGLSFYSDNTNVATLNNNACPSTGAPRNKELWTYATSDGRRIVLSPDSCR